MSKTIEYIALPDIDRRIEESIHDSINFFKKLCPYCSNNLFSGHIRNKIHVDHFIPISKGGQNVPWNVLPVCQKCNSKKKDKRPEDFLLDDKYNTCFNYLKEIESRYVGNLQNDLEKFLQIKAYLSTIKLHDITRNEIYSYFEKVYQMTFDKKAEMSFRNDKLNKETLGTYSYDDELQTVKKLFLKHFEQPMPDKKTYKLTVTEIMKTLQEKCSFDIRRGMITKILKEQGFTAKLERLNSQQCKRIIRLSSKLQPTKGLA